MGVDQMGAAQTPRRIVRKLAPGSGGGKGRALHRSFSWGSIGMTTFAFGEGDKAAA